MRHLDVIDSHTGGEPTRVILEGGIPLVGESMAARREDFRNRFDPLRTAIICEPRGSDVLVGAALTPPTSADAECGVVFFNNAGYLGMCGHGTIGVVETLRHLGRIQSGRVKIDTPVGPVVAELSPTGEVAIENVPCRRTATDVRVELPGEGTFIGDVAYGGNWFYFVSEPRYEISLNNALELSALTLRIRAALAAAGITGDDGLEIDHVELEGEATHPDAHSRNFVMCPGGAYDRSPCGTGTSAKLACLYQAGELREGEEYIQESITGSVFRGRIRMDGDLLIPTIVGRAYVTAESRLLFGEDDPLREGLRP